ncbi:MAG: hypothetical protein WDO19_02590 [Bacteroidota bacterium]|jgi:hypothetical protein
MYSYGLLEVGCHYLIQEKENAPISLIKPTVESDHCLFVTRYDEPMVTEWKRKNDSIHDIIECLTDDGVKSWEKYYNSEDAYYEDDDED